MYIAVHDWMVELGLSGNALLVYALIYGFSANGGEFSGSAEYISKRIGAKRRSVVDALKTLESAGLIKRRAINERNVNYAAADPQTCAKNAHHMCKKCT